jgi:hypothetical protein
MYFNLYLHYHSIYFYSMCLSNVYKAIGVEHVCVGYVVNLYVIRLGTVHLTLTCKMHGFQIIQRILDDLRIATIAC